MKSLVLLFFTLPLLADIGVINTKSMRSAVLFSAEGQVVLKECLPAVADVFRDCSGKVINSVPEAEFFSSLPLDTGNLSKTNVHDSIAFSRDVLEKAKIEQKTDLIKQYQTYVDHLETLLVIADALEGASEWKIYQDIPDKHINFSEILTPLSLKIYHYECLALLKVDRHDGQYESDSSYTTEVRVRRSSDISLEDAQKQIRQYANGEWVQDGKKAREKRVVDGAIECTTTVERHPALP